MGKDVGRDLGTEGRYSDPNFSSKPGHLENERGTMNYTGTIVTHRDRAGKPGPTVVLRAQRCLGRKGRQQADAGKEKITPACSGCSTIQEIPHFLQLFHFR